MAAWLGFEASVLERLGRGSHTQLTLRVQEMIADSLRPAFGLNMVCLCTYFWLQVSVATMKYGGSTLMDTSGMPANFGVEAEDYKSGWLCLRYA